MTNLDTVPKAILKVHLEPRNKTHRPLIHVAPEHIRNRAYEIFQSRGANAGDAQSDWLQAEYEIKNGIVKGDNSGAQSHPI